MSTKAVDELVARVEKNLGYPLTGTYRDLVVALARAQLEPPKK